MELRHLRYFLAVAEELNFTRAAARLGIGQPPLSQQIKDLEAEVGTALFRRVPHGAELTPAGAAFLAEAQAAMDAAARARVAAQRAARGESGRLRVGFTGSAAFNAIVPRTIRQFTRAYPDVQLTLEESNTQRLLDGLNGGELDAAFLRPGPDKPSALRLRILDDEAMVVVLPAAHAAAGRAKVALAELATNRFLLFPRINAPPLYDEIIDVCRRCGFEPRLGQVAPQMSSIINLVATEAGVSLVPASMAQVKVEGVSYIPFEGPAPVARLTFAWRPDLRSITLKNFVQMSIEP